MSANMAGYKQDLFIRKAMGYMNYTKGSWWVNKKGLGSPLPQAEVQQSTVFRGSRSCFSEADDGQVREAPRSKLKNHVTLPFPIREACLVQQEQCRALIPSTVCRALVCPPVQINNGFGGKLTDGHRRKIPRVFFCLASVIIGYL